MTKRIAILLVLIFVSVSLIAQKTYKIDLSGSSNRTKSQQREKITKNTQGFILNETIESLEFIEKDVKEGSYLQFLSEGMTKTFNPGQPDLPVFSKLIEIPLNQKAIVKVIGYEEQIIELKDYNLKKELYPAQPSVAKSTDPKDVPFYKNKEVYSKNDYFKNELLKFEDQGYLRNKHIGYIEISPFEYNPVTNTIKVLNNIEIEVTFEDDIHAKRINSKNLESPYFNNISYNTINSAENTKAIISGPVKYVIVSDRMFETTLEPFIEWKIMKGFNVITAYTDSIGTTPTAIKEYLKEIYDNPADGVSPSFVLLVGDVAQIPAFSGAAGGHKTDLYYAEYTGDRLPEVFIGRFSAENIGELQPQIYKTLEVEKYEMPDPSYLENVVLVAGVDGSYASKWGNGAVNYANTYYTNEGNDINSYYYLYNDTSGVMSSNSSGASASIRGYISDGISFGNYSAHCSSSGWSNPSFSKSQIDALTNEHMYPLLIGNCCESNTFNDNDCFGEEILMAENKGAVGYIGGSNLTYWDEDYWWAVGASSIVANPVYDSEKLGAYDRSFHLNGESKEDWYLTQGQINVAGNLAVEASTSPRKTYYWEIYHLMGDPSLTPYVSIPEALIASYNSEVILGASSFQVTAEEDAYVAISKDGVLLDAKLADVAGIVDLTFDALSTVGNLDIVITKQNRQPIIDQVVVIPATTPYVVLEEHTLDDILGNGNGKADFGETIDLDVKLKNLSIDFDAFFVNAILSSTDPNVVITDATENYGTILKTESKEIQSVFTLNIKNKIIDQQVVKFTITLTGKDSEENEYTWESNLNLTLNAPLLKIEDLIVDDTTLNNNGFLDPGETAPLILYVSNEGNASITQVTGVLEGITGSSLVDVANKTSAPFSLGAGETKMIVFETEVNEMAIVGTDIEIKFRLDDIYDGYYSVSKTKELTIGEPPVFLISDEGVNKITTAKAYFYDSGGELGNYTNDEDYTITFLPNDSTLELSVNFIEFNVESESTCDYDKLSIYNGNSKDDTLIGEYCGTDMPVYYKASNMEGALTFVFTSDYSEVRRGWKAEITQNIEEPASTTGVFYNENLEMKVYPNPSNGVFNFEIPGTRNEKYNIKVYDILGSLVYNKVSINNSLMQIDISDKANGIYFLRAENENNIVVTKKIIKK